MKLVAITNCPTGVAHTYMAAEALLMAAKSLDQEIKVETQGNIGIENTITVEDLASADAVIIASDKDIDKTRFKDIPLIEVSINEAIMNSKGLILKTLDLISEVKKSRDKKSESIFEKIRNMFNK